MGEQAVHGSSCQLGWAGDEPLQPPASLFSLSARKGKHLALASSSKTGPIFENIEIECTKIPQLSKRLIVKYLVAFRMHNR